MSPNAPRPEDDRGRILPFQRRGKPRPSMPQDAEPDTPVEELAKFLAARILRPVVGHYREDTQFKVAAFHKRTLGGTNGILEIGQDSIQFVSDKPADSRTWLSFPETLLTG